MSKLVPVEVQEAAIEVCGTAVAYGALDAIPIETHIVEHPSLDIYSDAYGARCQSGWRGGRGRTLRPA